MRNKQYKFKGRGGEDLFTSFSRMKSSLIMKCKVGSKSLRKRLFKLRTTPYHIFEVHVPRRIDFSKAIHLPWLPERLFHSLVDPRVKLISPTPSIFFLFLIPSLSVKPSLSCTVLFPAASVRGLQAFHQDPSP